LDKVFEAFKTFIKYFIPGIVGAILGGITLILTFGVSGSFSEILTEIAIAGVVGSSTLILLTYLFPKTVGAIFGLASEFEVND